VEIIFDVGANHGQSAAIFRQWYRHATIHCFEPVSATFRILNAAVGRWPTVQTHNIGFGAIAGPQSVVLQSDDRRTHLGTVPSDAPTELIELDTLDAFCASHQFSRIDYLKVDTEGHDLAVLHGAASLLRNGSVAIVEVEAGMNVDNRFHASAESLATYLASSGYRLFAVYEQVLEWPTADAYLRRANLVFVSPETVRRNRWIG